MCSTIFEQNAFLEHRNIINKKYLFTIMENKEFRNALLEAIKNELKAKSQDLKEFGLEINLEKTLL